MRETIIKLPQDADGNPDWVYMEQYVQSLSSKEITTTNTNKTVTLPPIYEWIDHRLGDLFSQMYRAEAHIKTDFEFYNMDVYKGLQKFMGV